jgi:hypothetical protein
MVPEMEAAVLSTRVMTAVLVKPGMVQTTGLVWVQEAPAKPMAALLMAAFSKVSVTTVSTGPEPKALVTIMV